MKKSECFRLAQLAVLESGRLSNVDKLEVIRELQDKESTALYVEKRDAEESLKKAAESSYRNCEKYASTTPFVITDSAIAEVKAFERGDTENAESGK